MATSYADVLTSEELDSLALLPEVIAARQQLDDQENSVVSFTVPVPAAIQQKLGDRLGVTLCEEVPMRWLKGDTHPHVDRSASRNRFDRTTLMYMSDSPGTLRVAQEEYPIHRGAAYSFVEGTFHETIDTGSTPRLLLGPMSEHGTAVGFGPSPVDIEAEQGGIITITQDNNGNIYYAINNGPPILINSSVVRISNISTPPTAPVYVKFGTDLTLQNYIIFDCASDYITFGDECLGENGTRAIVTISGLQFYSGLIRNNTKDGGAYNNIVIRNIEVRAVEDSSLSDRAGWIGTENFAKGATGNKIINCRVVGNVPNNCGGIVGANCTPAGTLLIEGCVVSGDIGERVNGNEGGAGGIVGRYASGRITISRCSSTGNIIYDEAGGILGADADDTNGEILITNCYSTGDILGTAGGIVGANVDTDLNGLIIDTCYCEGDLQDINNGGLIVGAFLNGPVKIRNCFTLGFGTALVGAAQGATVIPSNLYILNGQQWNDGDSTNNLLGKPLGSSAVGEFWISPNGINQGYRLRESAYSPYPGLCAGQSTLQLQVQQGVPSAPGLEQGYDYTLLSVDGQAPALVPTVSISSSGAITSTAAPGTVHTLFVYSTKNPYSTTEIIVTVEGGSGGACCPTLAGVRNLSYETRYDFAVGKSLLLGPTRQPLSYEDRMKLIKARSFV